MDELLQEVGFTEDELAELTEYQNTVKNLETVIQDEVMSIVYDEDTGEPKSAMVPPERFIEFMDNNYDIVGGAIHPKPMHYDKIDGYWKELQTRSGDVGNAIWANIIHPSLKAFNNDWLYLSMNNVRDSWQKACREYAKLLDCKSAPQLVTRPNPNLIMFQNGVYDFKTNEIRESKPEDYQTIKMDYPLVPTTERTITEDWLELLVEENLTTLMELIGYLFYREYKYAVYTFFINGDKTKNGSNGKSSVLRHIRKLVSDNTSSVSLKDLDGKDKFATSAMYNKLANLEADAPDIFIDSLNTLKTLTGNDSVPAEYKGKDKFEFVNYAKLIFATNHLPRFRDLSEATRSRQLFIPFNTYTEDPEVQKQFRERFNLEAELRESPEELGKFAWRCIQAFRKLLIEQPNARNPFTKTEQQEEMVKNYLEDNNTILQYFNDDSCLFELTGNEEDFVPAKGFYTYYYEWCKDPENNMKELNSRSFKKRLEEQDGVKYDRARVDGQQVRVWKGVKQKDNIPLIQTNESPF